MVALLLLERQQHPLINRARTTLNDAIVPMIDLASTPSRWLDDSTSNVRDWIHAHNENNALKNENNVLRKWQQRALILESENRRLRALLHMEALPLLNYTAARIVGNDAASMEHSLFIRLTPPHNFQNNMAVMTHQGLVGRLQDVGTSSARVLLSTDANSRIPVMTEGSRIKAILVGNNSDHPELQYLPDDVKITKGERIISSGDGGVFPAGIPIGIVVATGSTPKINLYIDRHSLEHVLIATEKGL